MFNKIIKLINEVHYKDYYPKQFSVFMDKYKNADLSNLYVHFSNFKNDVIDKRINMYPSTHGDPAGVYTYPARYVIDHPMDVGFGTNRKYIAIIKNVVPDKTLVLNSMTRAKAINLLNKAVPDSDWKAYVDNNIKDYGSAGNLFYSVLKNEQSQDESSLWMNRFFVKNGIYVLEDKSTSRRSAIIHEDEPEQAIFMTRDSFEIVEVFELRKEPETGRINKTYEDRYLQDTLIPEIISRLGAKTNQKFKYSEYLRIFQSDGYTINYVIEYPRSVEHRQYSDYSEVKISFRLKNNRSGSYEDFIFKGNETIEDMVNSMSEFIVK